MPTINGTSILGFCDTGGGFTALYPATITNLKLESKVSTVEIEGRKVPYILVKDVLGETYIPTPKIPDYYKQYITSPFFEVPDDKELVSFTRFIPQDAFLGQFFFIEHAWTFDYKTGKIYINTPLSLNAKDPNMQVLGFKKDKSGNKRFGHASMKIVVDGQIIDVLFDTGASFLLGENAKKVFGADKKSAGGSFIAKSIFDMWHQQHPGWRVVEKGEMNGSDMIEVPEVQVGNLKAGPAWFSKRPDEAWSKGMIGSMDKVVKGAIGGSFLQYFKVQIDYNSELIRFEQ